MTQNQRGSLAGLLLVAVGVIALLANLGLISADALLGLLDLWPLPLIVIGLQLIVRRLLPPAQATLAGAAILALAVVGALGYISLVPPPAIETTTATAPLGGLNKAALDLGLGAATLEIHSSSLGADLYKASFQFPRGAAPDVSLDNGTVSISDHNSGFRRLAFGRRHVSLTLNADIPWTLSVGGGATDGTLDLRLLNLTSLDVSGGANRESIGLPPPHSTVTVSISGGASSLTLHRPRGTPVSVQISGGASNLDADGHHVSSLGSDQSWSSPGYDAAQDRYQVDVSGGASSVKIDQSAG